MAVVLHGSLMKIFETDNVIGAWCLLYMEKVVYVEKIIRMKSLCVAPGNPKKYIEGCAEARFRRQDRCWCWAKNSSQLEFFSFQFGYYQEI